MKVLKRVMVFAGYVLLCFERTVATDIPCPDNRTASCIQSLATFITLSKPPFVPEEELDRLCSEAEAGQSCSSDFLRYSSCITSEEKLRISLQISRSQALSQLLCKEGNYARDPNFRKEYLMYIPCLEKQLDKIRNCYLYSKMPEDPEFEVLRNFSGSNEQTYTAACCPVSKYISCSKDLIGSKCSGDSANIVYKVLMKASGRQLYDFCTDVDSTFPSVSTSCVSSAQHIVYSFAVIIALYFFTFLF
ncbi:hypothetical protein X975_23447, partial [Stegodyphus mimosarum]